VTAEDFKDPKQLNVFLSQLTGAVQALQGSGGRTTLFSGVDVQGETVTGLGAPQGDTDAVSLAHAQGNYSAPAVGPQLDIGGSNALKGLTSITLAMTQAFSGTIPLAKLTGGGSNGNVTVKNGLIVSVVAPT
jgi:hypothetical protein